MKRDGKEVRERAVQSLKDSRRCGYSLKQTLRRLSLDLDMGVPAARSVREFLIRSGQWEEN